MRAIALCLFLLLGPPGNDPALAQSDPAHTAQRAAQMLERAALSMAEADGARDRVEALSETIRAYEEGLSALREGIRRAAIRERSILLVFEAERERLASLLGVLQTMQRSPAPLLLIHPSGPIGTARSGMILSDVTPAVAAEAEALRGQLEEVATLRALQESARDQLAQGLQGVQRARTALSQAMAERRTLPPRFAQDIEALQQVMDSADSLDGFAMALRATAIAGAPVPALPDFAAARGELRLPVLGRILRDFDTPDAAGITRPGLVLATGARALVSAPWPATIRYAGPLLDYGTVVVLEPQGDYLIVLAGLGEVFGRPGDLLAAGDPVGLMGGGMQQTDELIVTSRQPGGEDLSETLYMELRVAGEPVDPTAWFITETSED